MLTNTFSSGVLDVPVNRMYTRQHTISNPTESSGQNTIRSRSSRLLPSMCYATTCHALVGLFHPPASEGCSKPQSTMARSSSGLRRKSLKPDLGSGALPLVGLFHSVLRCARARHTERSLGRHTASVSEGRTQRTQRTHGSVRSCSIPDETGNWNWI